MPPNESRNTDKRFEYLSNMARNIVWAHGDAVLTSNQRVELYGGGVDLEFAAGEQNYNPSLRKKNPLPIADVIFHENHACIFFNETDYKEFLNDICRPDNIDGHKAASYYIGVGVAYRMLDEQLSRSVAHLDEPHQEQRMRKFINIITRPLKREDVEFVISNIADHEPSIRKNAIKIFENIFLSDDTRLGRINALRYAVAAHTYAIEQSDEQWALWSNDNRDRVGYSLGFVEACTLELIDQTKLWVDKMRIAEIFNRDIDFDKNVDSIPEILIAGSLPMSSKELNEINDLLVY